MRPGFLLAILSLVALLVLALVFISPKSRMTTTTESGPTTPAEASPSVQPPAQGEANLAGRALLRKARSSTNAHLKEAASHHEEVNPGALDEQREAQVAARISELRDLSSKRDIASLETLLSEVRNPAQEIRQAALDSISQSGNRNAIPGLQEAAAQTEDAGEKQAIEEVIDFLKLPTLTEILRNQSATNNNNAPHDRP
jgi:hypothetical protein